MKIVTAFESPDAPQLELLRAALGIALLANFAPLTFDLAELYGDGGWISREAFVAASVDTGWYSVLAWVRGPNQLAALHVAFLAAALAFTVGSSRVFLRVHFASDVAAGFASGTAWLAVCLVSIRLTQWWREGRGVRALATAPVTAPDASSSTARTHPPAPPC